VRHRDNDINVYDWEFDTTIPFSADISGLTAGTWYTARVCSIDGNRGDWRPTQDFQALPVARPADWEWWSVVAEDQPIAFTVAEWSAFYSKINEFLEYRGQQPWPNFVPVDQGRWRHLHGYSTLGGAA
jgi:hypothetical protein